MMTVKVKLREMMMIMMVVVVIMMVMMIRARQLSILSPN